MSKVKGRSIVQDTIVADFTNNTQTHSHPLSSVTYLSFGWFLADLPVSKSQGHLNENLNFFAAGGSSTSSAWPSCASRGSISAWGPSSEPFLSVCPEDLRKLTYSTNSAIFRSPNWKVKMKEKSDNDWTISKCVMSTESYEQWYRDAFPDFISFENYILLLRFPKHLEDLYLKLKKSTSKCWTFSYRKNVFWLDSWYGFQDVTWVWY